MDRPEYQQFAPPDRRIIVGDYTIGVNLHPMGNNVSIGIQGEIIEWFMSDINPRLSLVSQDGNRLIIHLPYAKGVMVLECGETEANKAVEFLSGFKFGTDRDIYRRYQGID